MLTVRQLREALGAHDPETVIVVSTGTAYAHLDRLERPEEAEGWSIAGPDDVGTSTPVVVLWKGLGGSPVSITDTPPPAPPTVEVPQDFLQEAARILMRLPWGGGTADEAAAVYRRLVDFGRRGAS